MHEREKKEFLKNNFEFEILKGPAYHFSRKAVDEFFKDPIICFYFAYFLENDQESEDIQNNDKTVELFELAK